MPDLAIVFDGLGTTGDLAIVDGDLGTGDELRTAIVISLFTERGWWADRYEQDPIGSRLLTLRRAKHTQQTLLRGRDYCREALAWLIEDGVASAVAVQTEWQGERLAIAITLTQPGGGATRYDFVWGGV